MTPKSNSLFGNLFDLNGDGDTDASEAALGFMIIEEMDQLSDSYDLDDDLDLDNDLVPDDEFDIE